MFSCHTVKCANFFFFFFLLKNGELHKSFPHFSAKMAVFLEQYI